MDQLTELAYSKWACHYSKNHWICNEPLWDQLPEQDQKFWKDFVGGILLRFKTQDELKPQLKSAV